MAAKDACITRSATVARAELGRSQSGAAFHTCRVLDQIDVERAAKEPSEESHELESEIHRRDC